MALEYRLTLAGMVSMDEVAARAFPDPADRPTPSPSGQTLAVNLDDRYGFTVSILTETDGRYGAPPQEGDDFEFWEWEPGAAVDLTFAFTWDGDRFSAAFRSVVTAIARVLANGTEDAAVMVSGHTVLLGTVPITVWGFSQGAWAAALTAATDPQAVAALVVVSACGVGPAAQMRYGTAEYLRHHGYGEPDVRQMLTLREAIETYLRGGMGRHQVQALLDRHATRPWFALSHLPRQAPPPGTWQDMDFDPVAVFAQVRCPVLACYGSTDAWVPVDASVTAWRRAGRASGNTDLTIVRLPGCDHWPILGDQHTHAAVSPEYTDILRTWLPRHLSHPHP